MVEKSTAIKVAAVAGLIVISVIVAFFFAFGATSASVSVSGSFVVGGTLTATASNFEYSNGGVLTVSFYNTPNGITSEKALVGSCIPSNVVNNIGSCSITLTVTSTMVGYDNIEATEGSGGNTAFDYFTVGSTSTTTTTITTSQTTSQRSVTTSSQVTTSTSLVKCYTLVVCTPHGNEPPGMQYPTWALTNVTINALSYSPVQSIGLTNARATIQGISSTVQISAVAYNGSAIQIEFGQNVSVSLQIPSSEAPVAVYSDGNLINTWTYSNGVLSIVADPYTVSVFYTPTSTPTHGCSAYDLAICLGLPSSDLLYVYVGIIAVVLVAASAIIVVRRKK